jgi:signal peptidase II
MLKNIAWLIALAIFFILDRLLKGFALTSLGRSTVLIPQLLSFNFIPNYNIAFSLPLGGNGLSVLIAIIIAGLIFLEWHYRKELSGQEKIALWAIIVGAVSNLFDRLSYGFVIDYFDCRWFTVFNLADTIITLGAAFLIISLFIKPKTSTL